MKNLKIAAIFVWLTCSQIISAGQHRLPNSESPNVVVQWNSAVLQGIRDSRLGPPMVARALAIVHTCMYDAWALYSDHATPTQLSRTWRRPSAERNDLNRREAISYAAFRAAVDLLGHDESSVFRPLMAQLGYDPENLSTDGTTPAGIGNAACNAVLEFRHHDGANQLGDLSSSGMPYADYTGYQPVNPAAMLPVDPSSLIDPNRWQPLSYRDGSGGLVTQSFVAAQWGFVTPFALSSGHEFRTAIGEHGPASYGSAEYFEQAQELVQLSAHLTDQEKVFAEYWKDGPNSETPPGHWCLFAQFISRRDHHTMDEDAKLFFALTNAEFDASIAAWDAKRAFDSVRPASAIPFLFHGQQIQAWGGPGKGTLTIDGKDWIPYQPGTFPTPAFPEHISGHSTFSAAAATILRLFTRSDRLGDSVTFFAGSSAVEPGLVPQSAVTLRWETFTEAANQAGISRRLGGIHFRSGDLVGRALGKVIALQAWTKANLLWAGVTIDTLCQARLSPDIPHFTVGQ